MAIMSILIGFSFAAYAQQDNGFVITKTVEYNKSELQAALLKCQFDNYRKMNSRVILHFDDGSTIELLSFNELDKLGIPNDKTFVVPEDHQLESVFSLNPKGYIVETVDRVLTLDEKKRLGLVK